MLRRASKDFPIGSPGKNEVYTHLICHQQQVNDRWEDNLCLILVYYRLNFAPHMLMSPMYSSGRGQRSTVCSWELKTGRTLIIRVQSDSKDQSKVHWCGTPTDWTRRRRVETSGDRRTGRVCADRGGDEQDRFIQPDICWRPRPWHYGHPGDWCLWQAAEEKYGTWKTIYSLILTILTYSTFQLLLFKLLLNQQNWLNSKLILVNSYHDLSVSLCSFYQSCALLFSLLPFFLASGVYFYLWTPDFPASIMHAGVKSAPTLLLAAVVLRWNGGQSILGVVGGLVFSAVGDCCLVWPELFLHGGHLDVYIQEYMY